MKDQVEGNEKGEVFAEKIGLAKEHVYRAAQILRALGAGEARVAWLLEDALNYLDEVVIEETGDELPIEVLAELQKAGNG